MSSLNTGLGEFFAGAFGSDGVKNEVSHRLFFAHVLDIVNDEFSIWYDGPDSIGAVRARILMTGYNKYEDEQDTLLYPLDRSYIRVPFPGEQVVGIVSFGPAVAGRYLMRYYYWKILTVDQNITYSGQPFTGTDPYSIKPGLKIMVDVSAEAKRFETKLPYDKALLDDKAVNQKTRQGERTVESRFGAMIKFTSTPDKVGMWNNSQINNQIASSVGDPLVIIGANPKTSNTNELTTRDLDVDLGSNIYLGSTQNLPTKLGCSTKLHSWNVDVRAGKLQEGLDETTNLQTLFGGGFNPENQLAIALAGSIGLPGQSGGTLSPVAGINEAQAAGIQAISLKLKEAGFGWQSVAAIVCVCGKECGLVPVNESSYSGTSPAGLRKLFGKYLTNYTDEQLLQLRTDDVLFYDTIYGYLTQRGRDAENTSPGDGYKYRGRGYNQITFKSAYRKLSDYTKTISTGYRDYVSNPDLLNDVENAAIGAAWYFDRAVSQPAKYREYSGEAVNPKQGTNLDVLIHYYVNANAGMGNDWNSDVVITNYNKAKNWESAVVNFFNSNPQLMQ